MSYVASLNDDRLLEARFSWDGCGLKSTFVPGNCLQAHSAHPPTRFLRMEEVTGKRANHGRFRKAVKAPLRTLGGLVYRSKIVNGKRISQMRLPWTNVPLH